MSQRKRNKKEMIYFTIHEYDDGDDTLTSNAKIDYQNIHESFIRCGGVFWGSMQ